MKKIAVSKGTMILIIVLAVVAVAGVGFGTFAFFTATATSEKNEITSGTLSMQGNGENENFRFDIASTKLQPGDYITSGANNTALIEIDNTGTLDMVFLASFKYADGKQSNFLSNGLVFEQLTRTVKDENDAVQSTTNYVNNFVLDTGLNTYQNTIDKYNIKGESIAAADRPADNLISVREWIEFCNSKDGGLAKVYVGKLAPGHSETWTLKIKYHDTCGNEYNIKNGFNLFMDFSSEATQNNVDAIFNLISDQDVLVLDFDNTNGDFTQLATKWNNEL